MEVFDAFGAIKCLYYALSAENPGGGSSSTAVSTSSLCSIYIPLVEIVGMGVDLALFRYH